MGRGEGLILSAIRLRRGLKMASRRHRALPGPLGTHGKHPERAALLTAAPHSASPLPGTVKFFRYFTCISNSVILLKFIQRIYAYEIII